MRKTLNILYYLTHMTPVVSQAFCLYDDLSETYPFLLLFLHFPMVDLLENFYLRAEGLSSFAQVYVALPRCRTPSPSTRMI